MSKLTEEEILELKQYARLKVQARGIDKELEVLKPVVKEVLVRIHAEDTPVETEDGKLSLRPRRSWTYSPETQALMDQVKDRQRVEEATGVATFETSFDVYFK